MATVGLERSVRVSKLREGMFCRPELCLERAYLMTESYKETESDPPVIRRAKALEKILKEMTIRIDREDLIVGKATSKRVAGPLIPEVQWQWYPKELDTLSERESGSFQPLTEEERAKIREILFYWNGKSVYDKWCSIVPEDFQKSSGKSYLPGDASAGFHMAHCCPGYERELTRGLNEIKRQVNEESGKLDLAEIRDFEKYIFLKAVNITLEALISFAERYAELAESMSAYLSAKLKTLQGPLFPRQL